MNVKSGHSFELNCPTGRWTLTATILASSMAFIDTTALNVILPSLQRDLAADGSDLFWVLNSYLLMLASLIIVGGSLGDRMGRVRVFNWGIIVFTIGSLLCGLAPTIEFLIIFRTVQGIGGAFMIPGSLSIISAVFSKEDKGKAIGTWSAATTIVTICGPVLGGALADIGWWRQIFFINLPLGIFSIYILSKKVPESRESDSSAIDWKGAITLVLSLTLITLGFLEMPELGVDHWMVVSSLIIGVILLIVFIYLENHIHAPMMPLELFANRTFSGVNLLTFFLYAALGAMMLFLSLNVIQIQGYSQFQAGLTFLPFTGTMVVLARIMGGMTDKYGARRFLIAGPIITGLGIAWLSQVGMTLGPSEYWTTYFPGFMVFAVGMSITVVPLTTAVMNSVDKKRSGIASGINNSITRISSTFINAILGATAIYLFSDFVADKIGSLELSNSLTQKIMEEARNLGEAKAPDNLHASIQRQINSIYASSFVRTYEWVGIMNAVLAFTSGILAFFMVKSERK